MKYKIFFSQIVVSGLLALVITLPIVAHAQSASAKVTKDTAVVTNDTASGESKTTSGDSVVSPETKEKATGVWNSMKVWGISVYESVDAWRIKQLDVWVAIKAEKKEQLNQVEGEVASDRDARTDSVLEGEQISLYNGAGEELEGTGNVFLLKLYSFALGIFIIIFKSPIIFYAIAIFLIMVILSKIVDKIRGPRRI